MSGLYESMNKYFEGKYGDLDNAKKIEKKPLNESKKSASRKPIKEAKGSWLPVAKALTAAGIKMDGDINSPVAARGLADKVVSALEDAKKGASESDIAQFDRAIDIVNKRRNSPALLLTTIGTFYTGYKIDAGAPKKTDECVDGKPVSERMGRKKKAIKESHRCSYGTKNKINEAAGFPKYFLAFDHFEPDTLFTIKVNDEKQLKALKGWESWYIKDITDKKGFYLIGHSDEAFYLNKLPASNKEALRKLMIDELKQKIKKDEEFFDYLETHLACIDEDVSLDLDLSEDDDEAAAQIADNWFESIDDSYVDGDSNFEFKFVTMEEEKKNAADFSEFDSESDDEGFDESFKRASKSKINRKKVESLKSAPKRHSLKESRKIVSRKAMKEDLGEDIARYQRYVDYDMKHYGEISKKTQNLIGKAGLQVVKDQYGDYEVTAGRYEEACRFRKSMKRMQEKKNLDEADWVDEDDDDGSEYDDDYEQAFLDALDVVMERHPGSQLVFDTSVRGGQGSISLVDQETGYETFWDTSDEEAEFYVDASTAGSYDDLVELLADWLDTKYGEMKPGTNSESSSSSSVTDSDKPSREPVREAKKKKKGPDLWETIYGDLTDDGTQRINPETGRPYINLGAGYNYQDQIAVDRDGNIVVKTKEERDLKAAIDIADKYKDKGVTYNISQSKYDKKYPYWMTIEIPDEYKECFDESKLTEKRWAYTVSDDVSREFRDAVQSDDEDYERVRRAIIAVYKDIYENTDLIDEDDYEDWVTEGVEVVDFDDEDDVNFELGNLYDFCDNASVWIGI